MEIFEEAPLSFKINRKSPLAKKLKSSISDQLLHFLGDYTDDVLAEYITVLVCNGKHQIQAKDDLEAFLGERTGAFVSWLWGLLFQYAHDCKDASPNSYAADMKSRSYRSHEVHAHRKAYSDSSLTEIGNNFPKTCRVSSNDMELCKKILGTKKEQPQEHRSVSREAVHIARKLSGGTLRPSAGTIGRAQSFEQTDKYKLNENGFAGQIPKFPGREMVSKSLESSCAEIEEGQQGRETYAANISTRNPVSTSGDVPCQRKMSRGSVWDRLGKPIEENSVVNNESLEAFAGAVVKKQYEEDQLKLLLPARNENFDRNVNHRVHVLDKSHGAHFYSNKRKLEQETNKIVEPCTENNVRHKKSNLELNSSTEACAPVILSEMKDVKKKLQQIETEMSKLRSKQLGMSKERQPSVLSSSGVLVDSVEDVDSRTVFASNVHFAVTKEVLSSHFAKCGVVSGVIFPDNVKGCAYITFASKNSIEKAVALNGTSFYSRLLKVVRKGEEATSTTTKPPLGSVKSLMHTRPTPEHGKTSLVKPLTIPRVHHNLQWRRGPSSIPSNLT